MTAHRRRGGIRADGGWVIVPVLALLVIALGLGFALLALVDTQTSQGRQQRDVDAAQTLSEGVVAATATVLGSDQSTTAWPVDGPCRTVTHRLADVPTGTDLDARIATEVRARFAGSSRDLDDVDQRRTTYTASICPVQGQATSAGTWDQQAESRWDPSFLDRTVVAPTLRGGPDRTMVWVRGQADVRTDPTPSGARLARSRAVVSKVTQQATGFRPPGGYAVGAGGLSTDLASGLSSTLLDNASLVGGLLGGTLGTKPLIGDAPARIGTRCGLLTRLSLSGLGSTCLSGTLAGAGTLTRSLGLGQLTTLLGIDQQTTLGAWTMAPRNVVDAYRRDARRSGIYKATALGAGDVRDPAAPSSTPDCLAPSDGTPDASQVVFLERVGDGEQFCTVSGGSARILVVARGGVRITGSFRGVVYAPNLQECSGADGTCTTRDRRDAVPREVVRIEGGAGRVTGSVWADGSGGRVGVHPALATPSTSRLLGLGGGTTGVCALPVLGPLVQGLDTTLSGVLRVVGNLLGGLAGSQEQVRYVDAQGAVLATPPSGCDVLRDSLASLGADRLLDLYSTGGKVDTVVTQRRTRSCFALVCGAWSAWSARDTVSYTLPPLLSGGSGSVVGDVTGLLTSTLSSYQAITYDADVTKAATTSVTSSAAPVTGTFRNDRVRSR